MVGIQVGTYLRINTTGTLAFLTGLEITSVHAVHVGRRTTQIAEIALESVHLHDLLHLAQNALLGAA